MARANHARRQPTVSPAIEEKAVPDRLRPHKSGLVILFLARVTAGRPFTRRLFLCVCIDGRNWFGPGGETAEENEHSVPLRQNELAPVYREEIPEAEARGCDHCGDKEIYENI